MLIALGCATLVPTALLAADPAIAAPTSYYVDCSSRTAGSGALETPWRSLAAVNTHTSFKPGDSILFKRGSTCKGRLHPRGNGVSGSPIVIGAYGSGSKPTIAGGGTANNTGAVQLQNQRWWTIQDLHVTNRGTAAETNLYRSGVLVLNRESGRVRGVVIRRLTVDAVTSNLTPKSGEPRDYGGISVITPPFLRSGSGFDGLQISGNRVSRVGRTGIAVSNYYPNASPDRDVRITGNRVTRARGDSIVVRGSHDARIDHNVSAFGADYWPCKQCGQISPTTANAAIWPLASTRTVIEDNEVYGEHKLGGDGVGIDVDISSKDTVVQRNYLHNNEGGGMLFCGSNRTTVRFNILQNNERSAFVFIASIPAKNTTIYNNTVYSRVGNDAKVVHTFGTPPSRKDRVTGVTFLNNVVFNMDDSGYYTWPTAPKTRSNTYIGVHGIGEPNEVGKRFSAPSLRAPGRGGSGLASLNGYRPVMSTKDPRGTAIPKSATTDFFGKRVDPKRPPRGAAG